MLHNLKIFSLISERELESVQSLLSNLDRSMGSLMDSIEEMKPAYLHAMKLLSQANPPSAAQKNNLVFYGLAPEPLEVQVGAKLSLNSTDLYVMRPFVWSSHIYKTPLNILGELSLLHYASSVPLSSVVH